MMEQLKIKSYKNEGLESKLKWIVEQRKHKRMRGAKMWL